MTFDELKEKALALPYEPGIYIMRDKDNEVIYVGKAKKLKNRVSQYFQDMASHTGKTRAMVSKIDHFDVIIAANEFEALVLECATIKRYQPKYNILLKDGKGYPYIRLNTKEAYPAAQIVSKVASDGCRYYGPFGSRGLTQSILDAIRVTLQLPGCKKKFPEDIGKGRPCLYYHMNQCAGWCRAEMSQEQYAERIEQAQQLLSGNYKKVASQLRSRMLEAAENMEFELAAGLRDRLAAVEALGKKQTVTAGNPVDTDVIGYAESGAKACFAVLHYSRGNLVDKEYEIFAAPEDPQAAVSSIVKQYYLARGFAPRIIMSPFSMEDAELFAQLLEREYGRKVKLYTPQRGEGVRLLQLAKKNAQEEVSRITNKEEKRVAVLAALGKMLTIDAPERIESYDISNISGTDMVASMIVFANGIPLKRDYRHFKLEGMQGQDDYGAMRQVLLRRFWHYLDSDSGFDVRPDLLLIDGGINHARVAVEALQSLDLSIPVVGMVKDDRHRTRALVTAQGEEISLVNQQAVFSLIGSIQEETHRFAITYHRKLRSKRLKYSALDNIPGVGAKRKEELLRHFKSLRNIAAATLPELERLLPKNAAHAVYAHFHPESEEHQNL